MPISPDPKQRAKDFLELGIPALNEAASLGLVSAEQYTRVFSFTRPDGTPDADMVTQTGMQLLRDVTARRELARDAQRNGQFSTMVDTALSRMTTMFFGTMQFGARAIREVAPSLSQATGIHRLESLAGARSGVTGELIGDDPISIVETQLGPEHPSTAIFLNNLAGLLQARSDYDEARPLFERALKIKEAQLGPEHPSTAVSLNSLARLPGRGSGLRMRASLPFARSK